MPMYEGDTVEKAIIKGLHELGLKKEEVTIDVLNENKKGFLGFLSKPARVSIEPTVDQQITEAIEETIDAVITTNREEKREQDIHEELQTKKPIKKDVKNLENEQAIKELAIYLTNITKELNASSLVRVEKEDEVFIFNLDTDKPGMLIGKHGKILNALQYLAQIFIHRIAVNKLSIVVNVGDYRTKQKEILQKLAQRSAQKVQKTGKPMALEPMPAFERKQIHSILSTNPDIQTYSKGKEPYRYLVIDLREEKR